MICFDWWTVKVKRGWNGKPLLCSFYVLTHKHNSNYILYIPVQYIPSQGTSGSIKSFKWTFGLKVQTNSQRAPLTASEWWPLGERCQLWNRSRDLVEGKGRPNKMVNERDIWEKGGRVKKGRIEQGKARGGVNLRNKGRSWFSAEGVLSLRQQCGTTQGLVIVKSYQLTMGHQGIRG